MPDEDGDPERSVDRRGFIAEGVGAGAALMTVALPGSAGAIRNVDGVDAPRTARENPKVLHDPEWERLVVDGTSAETTLLGSDEDVTTVPLDEGAGADAVRGFETEERLVLAAPNRETKERLEARYGDAVEREGDDRAFVTVYTGVPEGTTDRGSGELSPGQGREVLVDADTQPIHGMTDGEVGRALQENRSLVDKIADAWLGRRPGFRGPELVSSRLKRDGRG